MHLAKLLKRGGNVLLLDEPTNDLDVETLQALEQAATAGCAVVIATINWFLDQLATHILAFEGEGIEFRQLPGLRGRQAPPTRRRRSAAALQVQADRWVLGPAGSAG